MVTEGARAILALVAYPESQVNHISVNISDYRDWLSAHGLSRNTIGQRVEFADARLRAWGTLDQPAHVIADWLADYYGWTRRTYTSHLRSLYAWAVEVGHVAASPVEHLRSTAQPSPRPRPLSSDELSRVIGTASGDLRAWLMLGFYAGLRCHELAKIRGEDINETSIHVNGKGGQAAILPTHPALWALAQQYPREGYWFPSTQARRLWVSESQIGNKVRAHFRALGIEGSSHRMRHSYCTSLSRAGVKPEVVMGLMRHKSLDTTMRYLAVDDDERRAAVRLLAA